MKFKVVLNGTDVNPYAQYGLTQNPFPQTAKAEYDRAALIIQKLAGDPIPDTDYIRKVLKDFPQSFIELCCAKFEKGKSVEFDINFEDK